MIKTSFKGPVVLLIAFRIPNSDSEWQSFLPEMVSLEFHTNMESSFNPRESERWHPARPDSQTVSTCLHHNLLSCFNGCHGSWLRKSGKMTRPKQLHSSRRARSAKQKTRLWRATHINDPVQKRDFRDQVPTKCPKKSLNCEESEAIFTKVHLLELNFKVCFFLRPMAVDALCAVCGEPGKLLVWKLSNWESVHAD